MVRAEGLEPSSYGLEDRHPAIERRTHRKMISRLRSTANRHRLCVSLTAPLLHAQDLCVRRLFVLGGEGLVKPSWLSSPVQDRGLNIP